jgi:adenosylhomocysteine nucleosidase
MRRENLWICVLLVTAVVCLFGCPDTRSGSAIERVGVMGALDSEIELIKEKMSLEDSSVVSGRRFYVGEVEGHRVVLVKAGVGKVNAAMTAQLMIERFGVDKVVFTGIAGGIAPDLYVGDVVISKKVIQHDYGLVSKDGFQPWRIAVGDSSGREVPLEYFEPDTQLVRIAMSAARELEFPAPDTTISGRVGDTVKVYLGCIVTGDQFIASEEKRRWLEETFDAYATEMEGGAVAQVCVSNGVPFVVVRTLSDLANEDASVDIEKFFAYASRNSAMLVLEMLRLMH